MNKFLNSKGELIMNIQQIIKPKTRNSLNNTYVGIYQSDFDTQNDTTHNIASRIVSDWKFDNLCKRNNINRLKGVKYYA